MQSGWVVSGPLSAGVGAVGAMGNRRAVDITGDVAVDKYQQQSEAPERHTTSGFTRSTC